MATGFPDWQIRAFTSADNFEQINGTVSDVEAGYTFSQEVKAIVIYNQGPNPVHIDFDAVATTGDFKVPSKAWFMIDLKLTSVHAVCADDETAKIYLVGTY